MCKTSIKKQTVYIIGIIDLELAYIRFLSH